MVVLINDQKGKLSSERPLAQLETGFSTFQDIWMIRDKLHHALAILDVTLNIVSKFSTYALTVGEVMELDPFPVQSLITELDQIFAEMETHKSAARRILAMSNDLFFIVSLAFCLSFGLLLT
jgi:hypothetical protein